MVSQVVPDRETNRTKQKSVIHSRNGAKNLVTLVLRQVPNDGYKSLDRGYPDDVLPVGASCARDLFTINFDMTEH